ncbi:MAG: nuclear transport factor 2 family protein, partial [Chloroflexi bacterium]|nr:nuclear transport factor 2 family protein [Chloroflexota bacterium]
ERYMHAVSVDDFDTQDVLIHDDYLLLYPQSGERIRGRENRRALVEGYPGRQEGRLRPTIDHITGTDDEWITKASWPAWSVVHLVGSADEFSVTERFAYPGGDTWHVVALITVRDGKIWRETDYFAAGRAPWSGGNLRHRREPQDG